MNHTIVEIATGRISAVLTCTPDLLALQFNPLTHFAVEGRYDDSQFYFDGGFVAFPSQPDAHHVFDWATKVWQDLRTLQDFKNAKWAEIKKARDAAIAEPLITPMGVFDADATGSTNIFKSVLLANNLTALGSPVAIDFTRFDDTVVVLNAAAMVQVGLLLAEREQLLRQLATQLRALIDAAPTAAFVQSITWP